MYLFKLPEIDGSFGFFEKSSHHMAFILILMGWLFLLIACIPWSPKYEVRAYVETIPEMVKIDSPGLGVIQNLGLKREQIVVKGQPLFRLYLIKGLLQAKEVEAAQMNLKQQLHLLKLDIKAQVFKLKKLKLLWHKRAVSFDEYQQALADLRHRNIEYQKTLAQLSRLKQTYIQDYKAPISGKIVDLNIHNQDLVHKNQLLFRIRPEIKDWRLKLKLPVAYKKDLIPGAEFRFNFPSNAKLRRYLVHAKLLSYSSVVMNSKQSDFIEAYARVLKPYHVHQELMPHMSLTGYLLGPKHTLIVWLAKMIFSI